MNKKEMEEKILELEATVKELTIIARLLIKGFKQTDNLTMVKEFIDIAKGNCKGVIKNTDFIMEIAKQLQMDLDKKKVKLQRSQNTRGLYI